MPRPTIPAESLDPAVIAQLPIITQRQACILLQINPKQMERLRLAHKLPHFRAGERTIRYDRARLLECLGSIQWDTAS